MRTAARTLLLILALSSQAQARQDALAIDCLSDVKVLCKGAPAGEVASCLRARFAETSPECRGALVKGALAAQACRADRRALCADVKAGGGRVTACLRERLERLGEDCRAALALRAAPAAQPPATLADGDLGALTCGQTLQARLGRAALFVAWLSGYRQGKAGAGTIAPGRLESLLDRVGAYCSVRPDAPLMDAVDAVAESAR